MAEVEAIKNRSGSERRQRQHARPIRLNDAELATCEEAASRLGLTFSSFARAAMLDAAEGKTVSLPVRSVRRPPVERELLARTMGQLGKVGGNLNQLTKAANEQHLDPLAAADLRTTLGEVRGCVAAIMEAMGRKAG